MPEAERKRFAAKAVSDIMKRLQNAIFFIRLSLSASLPSSMVITSLALLVMANITGCFCSRVHKATGIAHIGFLPLKPFEVAHWMLNCLLVVLQSYPKPKRKVEEVSSTMIISFFIAARGLKESRGERQESKLMSRKDIKQRTRLGQLFPTYNSERDFSQTQKVYQTRPEHPRTLPQSQNLPKHFLTNPRNKQSRTDFLKAPHSINPTTKLHNALLNRILTPPLPSRRRRPHNSHALLSISVHGSTGLILHLHHRNTRSLLWLPRRFNRRRL